MAADQGFMRYLKKAFLFHWNLLAVGAGATVGLLSGRPDVVLPLLGACEMIYLASLSAHPRFQAAVDAELHQSAKISESAEVSQRATRILGSLPRADRERFLRLRERCLQMRSLSARVKGAQLEGEGAFVNDAHVAAINRLLWITLKLLYSKNALETFFESVDEKALAGEKGAVQARLDALGAPEKDSPGQVKVRKSLEDTLGTIDERLKNYQRARENHEFIQVELDRLYAKVAGLAEMGISRQDPNALSIEVDSLSASAKQTELAMSELAFLTGLSTTDDAAPGFMESEVIAQGK